MTPITPIPPAAKPTNVFLRTLPTTIVGLVLLIPVIVFGYTGHLSPADTYAGVMALVGLIGTTGVYILASQWSNENTLPHLIDGVLLIAGVVVLGLHNIFDSAQLLALWTLIAIGTAGGGGAALVTAAANPPNGSTQSAL